MSFESLGRSIGRTTTDARCAVCGGSVGRDRNGRMLLHTTRGDGGKPEVCRGSDRGAHP